MMETPRRGVSWVHGVGRQQTASNKINYFHGKVLETRGERGFPDCIWKLLCREPDPTFLSC